MAFTKLIAFDRPLVGATIPGQDGSFLSSAELARHKREAYQAGENAARALTDAQIVEMRAEVHHLSRGVLDHLSAVEPALTAQLQQALPELATDIARRLLTGFEPPAEVVRRICAEALAEVFPQQDGLELIVSPRDAALLEKLDPDWLRGFPGLRLRADPQLVPGDCQVRSRFGLTDARLETKLRALQSTLQTSP